MDAQELAQYKSGCHTRAEGISFTTMDFLDLPTTPERFRAQMSLAEHYNRIWTLEHNPRGPRSNGSGEMGNTNGSQIRRC